jgi:elongation factor Ts
MPAVSASEVKELREKSGAGMLECKKALEENGGDLSKALDWLREKGIASAAKKASREAKEGLVGLQMDASRRKAVLVEVNCETDFVAKTEDFKALVSGLAQAALKDGTDALSSPAMVEEVKAAIGKLKENMVVSKSSVLEAPAPGLLGSYLHADGKLGTLVALSCGKAETEGKPAFLELAKDLAMQVAGAVPPALALSRAEVPAEWIAKEREIAEAQAKATGKPEAILKKIAEGKVAKALQEVSLLDQAFIKDPEQSVAQLVSKAASQLGDSVTVKAFARLKVGEAK